MSYLPPEIIYHILKFTDTPTLKNCLEIKYLAKIVQKELDKNTSVEMIKKAAFRDRGTVDDLLDRGRGVALAQDDLFGRGQDPLA